MFFEGLPCLRYHGLRQRSTDWWVICYLWLGVTHTAMAQNTNTVLCEVRKTLGNVVEVVFYIVMVGGFAVAAWMIIAGAYRFFTVRDGAVSNFVAGIVVAIVMTMIMTYFITQGQTFVDDIKACST